MITLSYLVQKTHYLFIVRRVGLHTINDCKSVLKFRAVEYIEIVGIYDIEGY